MREGLSSRPGCEVCALQAAPAEESRCSEGRVGWGSLVPGRKMESRGEAAPGLGTGYWSLFTGPRGRSASLLPARFLSACQFGGWGGGDCGRISSCPAGGRSRGGSCSAALPRAARALFPCLLRAESARTRRLPLFIFKANSVPPRRAAGPGGPGCAGRGRGVSGAQWRGSRSGPVSGLCCRSLVPMG